MRRYRQVYMCLLSSLSHFSATVCFVFSLYARQTWLMYVQIDWRAVRLGSGSKREQVEPLDNYWCLISQLCTCRALCPSRQAGAGIIQITLQCPDVQPFAFKMLLWQFDTVSFFTPLSWCSILLFWFLQPLQSLSWQRRTYDVAACIKRIKIHIFSLL